MEMQGKPTLTKDLWLSSVMDRAAYRLDDSSNLAQDLRALSQAGSCFAYAKVKADSVESCAKLEAAGFRLVDTNLLFSKNTSAAAQSPQKFSVRACERDETQDLQNKVYEVAASSFTATRFHLDPHCGMVIANKIKGEWVANFFRGARGDELLVAEDKAGKILGFLLVIAVNGKKVIDLIATHPSAQGKGVGRALVQALGAGVIDVGTQLANAPSIQFYQRLGFHLVEGKYVFHYHS